MKKKYFLLLLLMSCFIFGTMLFLPKIVKAGECIDIYPCAYFWGAPYFIPDSWCNPQGWRQCRVFWCDVPTGDPLCPPPEGSEGSCQCTPACASTWSWSDWGSCSVSCGGGTQSRTCSNSEPACTVGGCSGDSTQTCNTQSCCSSSAPAALTLTGPANGTEVLLGSAASMTWNAPSGWGTGCPSNNNSYTFKIGTASGNYNIFSVNTGATASYAYTTSTAGTNYWRVAANNGSQSTDSSNEMNICVEGWTSSARVSVWGTWSTCSAGHTRTRTRTCTEDCAATSDCAAYFAANCPVGSSCVTTGSGLSRTQTETQFCYGQVTGTFFDASDMIDCSGMAGAPKIGTGTLDLTGPGEDLYSAITNGSGVYTTTDMVVPNTYALTPNPGGSYITTPRFHCQGTVPAFVTFSSSSSSCLTQPCEVVTHDFGFWRVYSGWWQAKGGSVYGGTGIQSNIPGTVAAADQHLITQDANAQDGLAQIGSGSISLGTYPGLTVSDSGLNATSGYSGDNMDYNYFIAKMGSYTKTALATLTSKPTYTPVADGYEIYTYTGDVTMNWSPAAGEKVIYLIDGAVTVSANITVPTSSFLAVIADGIITFNASVTNVDGWWVGDTLSFLSAGEKSDVAFVGNGSFIGWSGVSLGRDLTGTLNNTTPAEKFVYRPDLTINAPAPMMQSKYTWRRQ